MDVEATDGGESGAGAFADERAASLRRMFPVPRGTAPTSADPSPNPSPIGSSGPPPARTGPDLGSAPDVRHAARWWIAGAVAVLTVGAIAGFVVFRPADGQPLPAVGPADPPAGGPEALAVGISASPRPGPSSAAGGPPVSVTPPSPTPPSPTATTPAGARATTSAARATATAGNATKLAGGPITTYSACTSGGSAQFSATFAVSYSWRHAFIDTDDDTGTGYHMPEVSGGLGADYMIENDALYRSEGSDWSWKQVENVSPLVSAAGGAYRWRVPLSELGSPGGGLRVVFNGSGGSAEAYTSVVETGTC